MLTEDNSACCSRCGRLALIESDEYDGQWIFDFEEEGFGVVTLLPVCPDCATEEEKEEAAEDERE